MPPATQARKLIPPDIQANDRFGYASAISGNYAIVGAYLDDDNGTNIGSVHMEKAVVR